jgi:hypothetical protein
VHIDICSTVFLSAIRSDNFGYCPLCVGLGTVHRKGLGMDYHRHTIISIILSIVAIASGGRTNIISLIISAIILYYMTRTEVKSYVGRGERVTK